MEDTKAEQNVPPGKTMQGFTGPASIIKNHFGPDAVLQAEKAAESEKQIQAVLAQQCLCKQCDGSACRQEVPYMVPLISGGLCGWFTLSLMDCPMRKALREQARYQELMNASSLPPIYRSFRFADVKCNDDNRTAIQAAYEIATHPDENQGLYLYGPPGTGKTLLVSLTGKAMCFSGKPVLFISVTDLLHLLRKHLKTDWQEIFQKYMDIPCLILDDLGAERLSDWSTEQLYRLIDSRYKAGLQTFISSNWSLEELESELMEKKDSKPIKASRIISRMTAMTKAIPVKGVDHRTKQPQPQSLFA